MKAIQDAMIAAANEGAWLDWRWCALDLVLLSVVLVAMTS